MFLVHLFEECRLVITELKLGKLHYQMLLIQPRTEQEGASFNENDFTQKKTEEQIATPGGKRAVSYNTGGK